MYYLKRHKGAAADSEGNATFGSIGQTVRECDVVEVDLPTRRDGLLRVNVLVVPSICGTLTHQLTRVSFETYDHLLGLDLSDVVGPEDTLTVDLLVGSDHYWRIVTGQTRRRRAGLLRRRLAGSYQDQWTCKWN